MKKNSIIDEADGATQQNFRRSCLIDKASSFVFKSFLKKHQQEHTFNWVGIKGEGRLFF